MVQLAEFREPDPVFPQAGRRAGHLSLQRQQRGNAALNLLSLAASRGQTSTADPTLAKLFADIRTAAATEGGIDSSAELNLEEYSYSPTGSQSRVLPDRSYRLQHHSGPPFVRRVPLEPLRWRAGRPEQQRVGVPGFPQLRGQASERYYWQAALRSTLSKSLVNEFIVGKADATGRGMVTFPSG